MHRARYSLTTQDNGISYTALQRFATLTDAIDHIQTHMAGQPVLITDGESSRPPLTLRFTV